MGVPLELTLRLCGRLQKSGVRDKDPRRKEEKIRVGFTSPTGRDTLPWGRDILYMTSLESTRITPKPITDKPWQVLTIHTDKLTVLEKHTESPRPDLQSILPLQFLMNLWAERESSVDQ